MITKTTYRSLDLVKGLAKGWQGDLNGREKQVLLYVAQYGRQNEPGYAFVWHPMRGMTGWAEAMGMPRRTLYRALDSLKATGVLVQTAATDTWGERGYGVPLSAMRECVNVDSLRVSNVAQECVNVDNPAPPLTCDDEVHNQGTNQSMKQPLTWEPPPAAVQEAKMYDDFDTPKDGPDDWAVPKEARQPKVKTERKRSPAQRLVRHFEDRWSIARCQNTSFGVSHSSHALITKVFKTQLETYSEEDLTQMITTFFDLAAVGQVRVSGDEMWRDFLNARKDVWRIVRESGNVSAPMDDHTERNRQNMERLRARNAKAGIKVDLPKQEVLGTEIGPGLVEIVPGSYSNLTREVLDNQREKDGVQAAENVRSQEFQAQSSLLAGGYGKVPA